MAVGGRGEQVILWRRLDGTGHDACRLALLDAGWRLAGAALFIDESRPCHLEYEVLCDADWRTQSGRVSGWLGHEMIELAIVAGADGRWSLNGRDAPAVTGCIDLDLNFSPATNLLPIRRLGLVIGQAAEVRAAWLRFPEFRLEPLPQLYRRAGDSAYHYEVIGGDFAAELRVDESGFVLDYAGIWQAEGTA
jgi:hypothetical protein